MYEICERSSVRLSYTKNSAGVLEILEENNYYPFGLKHSGYNNITGANPSYQYKYNGKELQESGMYDYGARFYMPDIGRWGVVDPLVEDTEDLYGYGNNDPIDFFDPTGMEAEFTNGEDPRKTKTIPEVHLKHKNQSNSAFLAFRFSLQGASNTFVWMGDNTFSTRQKFNGATPGTSWASQFFRNRGEWSKRSLAQKLGKERYKKIPKKLFGSPFRTNTYGGFAGRAIPIVGRTATLGLNYGISVYNVATADNKGKQAIKESAFLVGAEMGGTIGAKLGSFGGPFGAFVVGAAGAAVGGTVASTVSYEPCENCVIDDGIKMDGAIKALHDQN